MDPTSSTNLQFNKQPFRTEIIASLESAANATKQAESYQEQAWAAEKKLNGYQDWPKAWSYLSKQVVAEKHATAANSGCQVPHSAHCQKNNTDHSSPSNDAWWNKEQMKWRAQWRSRKWKPVIW